MKLNLQRKEQVVFKITKLLENALSVVVASLEGVTANELNNLRVICRKSNVYICVVRNTLMRRVFKDTVFKCLHPLFFSSNVIGFSTADASDCARIFVKFSKEHCVKFKIKGAVFDGVFIEESKMNFLASLPTYNDSIIKLIFILKESAAGKLIRILHILSTV